MVEFAERNVTPFLVKTGANFQDQNAIKRLAEQGVDSRAIAVQLGIDEQVVKNFMPGLVENGEVVTPDDKPVKQTTKKKRGKKVVKKVAESKPADPDLAELLDED